MTPPIDPKQRAKQRSSDDLHAVQIADAAESRSRAAMRLFEDERARADELQAELDRVKALAAVKVEVETPHPKSLAPGIIVAGKGWRLAVPLVLLTPLGGLLLALGRDYMDLHRQVKTLTELVSGYETRFQKFESELSDVKRDMADIKQTQAKQAGYLAGVLPKVGVTVPGLEYGGATMTVESDPLPPGAHRRPEVHVRTPVPAPPPESH